MDIGGCIYFVLGEGESGLSFFSFAEDIILKKNVQRIERDAGSKSVLLSMKS